jgi:hypothetical protein
MNHDSVARFGGTPRSTSPVVMRGNIASAIAM